MHKNNFWDSINYALQGLVHTLKTQINMKIHFFLAFVVLFGSLFFNISKIELVLLFFTIFFVIAMEMVNTAVEIITDMVAKEYNYHIKIAKNIAAGAVVISAINAVIVGYLIFVDQLNNLSLELIYHIKQQPVHLTFINLGLLFILVISLKAYRMEGTPLKGGMPSGHSAIAFSVATIMIFLTENFLVTSLVLFLALIVAQSRVQTGTHSFLEVLTGSILGILLTLIVFQLL